MDDPGTIALPEASPRDREVQAVVLELVGAYAFREAWQVLGRRLREIDERRGGRLEQVFLDWRELDPDARHDFLTSTPAGTRSLAMSDLFVTADAEISPCGL